nr:uncharacterized protein LOC109401113 [Aedes albopictus]
MCTIECECQLQHAQPVACCGDFLCPKPPVGGTDTPTGKSRVNAMRQLFERKIQVTENRRSSKRSDADCKSAPVLSGNNRRGSIEYDDDNVPPVMEQITVEDIPQDSTRFYRSHTKIVSVPNGVKIITTILANGNVSPGDEFGTVFETLIFPESEIIRQFEQNMKQGRCLASANFK